MSGVVPDESDAPQGVAAGEMLVGAADRRERKRAAGECECHGGDGQEAAGTAIDAGLDRENRLLFGTPHVSSPGRCTAGSAPGQGIKPSSDETASLLNEVPPASV